MMLQMFTVYDSKACVYSGPYFFRTVSEGVRLFSRMAAEDTSSLFYAHGADFTLFHCGTFDDSMGKVDMFSNIENLGTMLVLASNYRVSAAPPQSVQTTSAVLSKEQLMERPNIVYCCPDLQCFLDFSRDEICIAFLDRCLLGFLYSDYLDYISKEEKCVQ